MTAVPFSRLKSAARAAWKIAGPKWSHTTAQLYEFRSAAGTINRSFPELIAAVDRNNAAGGLWQSEHDAFFQGDAAAFAAFVDHVRHRQCLEIGSGPYGYLAPCSWIERRAVIDPLIDRYRAHQVRKFGRTLWTEAIETHAVPAETVVPGLVGRVDGAVICQNALDHTEDPFAVLNVIADYAAPGCYLLLWSDLWHAGGGDIGHRNITRCAAIMPRLLSGLGFDIVKPGRQVRDAGADLEFGCIARKR